MREALRRFVIAATMLALAGCAASVKRGDSSAAVRVPAESSSRIVLNMSGPPRSTTSSDWEAFKGEWRAAFSRAADAASVGFRTQEGPAKPTGEPGTLLSVYVDDYRYLTPGARYGFGIMTGNAYIESKVAFLDAQTGASFGEQTFNTSSSAWEGVFSAMTAKQVEALAAEVIREVKRSPGGTAQPRAMAAPPIAEASPIPPGPTASVTAPGAPVVPAKPAASTVRPAFGEAERDVRRMPDVLACTPVPAPVMTAKGPGFENYSVTCQSGDVLSVRCEFGNCRILK